MKRASFSFVSSVLAAASLVTSTAYSQSPSPAVRAPVRGGTVAFPVHVGEPPTYDCHATNSPAVMWRVAPHYSTLLKIDAALFPQVKGDLAQSWKVSPDNLSYTFKLHPNIRFHDGSRLTSADVKTSFDRMRNPPPGVISLRQGLLTDIATIESPDEQTVVFRFTRPNAAALQILAMPYACIYSARLLASEPAYPGKRVMGTGPYRFVSHSPGAEWVGERFADYFQAGKPYLDGFRAISVAAIAATNALYAGQVHFTMLGFTPKEIARFTSERADRTKVVGGGKATTFLPWFAVNTQREPLKDARVRRALNLAIDRWSASPAMEQVTPMFRVGGLLRPGSTFARSDAELAALPGFGRDIKAARDEARRLLVEAGQPNLKITLVNNEIFSRFGVFVADQLRQIGVTVDHLPLPTPQIAARRVSGDYDLIMDSPTEFVDDPTIAFSSFKPFSTHRSNLARVEDREFLELYEAQLQDMDEKSRLKRVRDLEAYLMKQSYVVPLFWQSRRQVVDVRLHGLDSDFPTNYVKIDLADLWLEPAASR